MKIFKVTTVLYSLAALTVIAPFVFVIFLFLHLFDAVEWSWWIVTLPLWLVALLDLAAFGYAMIIAYAARSLLSIRQPRLIDDKKENDYDS